MTESPTGTNNGTSRVSKKTKRRIRDKTNKLTKGEVNIEIERHLQDLRDEAEREELMEATLREDDGY